MSSHAVEILQLAEFIKVLGDAAKSMQESSRQLAATAGEITIQLHHAQRRLRVLEHAAGIIVPATIQPPSDDFEERAIQ